MNPANNSICENQGQALNSYLDSLLSTPPEMPALPQNAVIPSSRPIEATSSSGRNLKCFVFTVAGLKLALPLARVSEVVEFSGCRGASAPPLVLGHLLHENKKVPVLDTGHVILPENSAARAYRWLVIVDRGSYALACDAVHPNMEIAQDAVRWRTHLTKRRWLAGTLLQQRCALLDADEIYEQSADNEA